MSAKARGSSIWKWGLVGRVFWEIPWRFSFLSIGVAVHTGGGRQGCTGSSLSRPGGWPSDVTQLTGRP